MKFIKTVKYDEITDFRPKRISIESLEIVLFKKEKEIFAIENLCPHQLISAFHQSTLKNYILTCPMHGWSFDIRSGRSVAGSGKIRVYNVEVRDEDVWIEIPDA